MEEIKFYDPGFGGTDNYYVHPIYRDKIKYTDSVKYFMEKFSAYWTLDVMASYVPTLEKKGHDFVTFIFEVKPDKSCQFRAEDGNGGVILTQEIEYTSLTESVKLFWTNNVLLFPSDY